MKPGQKSTIYDIAQKAGASPSAVSAALNGSWKKRRLSKKTAERIQRVAREEGYTANRQARGLRKAESGLAGMVLPDHENRFFAALSQQFACEAHNRGLCPAIVHSGRDEAAQRSSVESLISFGVDLVIIAGATTPSELAQICRNAGLPHVFVDHPCDEAPSVVTDNAGSAGALTRILLSEMPQPTREDPTSWLYFVGGEPALPASGERIAGFKEQLEEAEAFFDARQILACGYADDQAERAMRRLYDDLGLLPAGLFINSIGCFEGVARFLSVLPEEAIAKTSIGLFDHDPFASLLRFPLRMVRQRADLMVAEAFRQLDSDNGVATLTRVDAELI